MVVITDASPVSHLGRFDLLRTLYERVVAPEAVFEELAVQGMGLPGSEEIRADWIERIAYDPDSPLARSLGGDRANALRLRAHC